MSHPRPFLLCFCCVFVAMCFDWFGGSVSLPSPLLCSCLCLCLWFTYPYIMCALYVWICVYERASRTKLSHTRNICIYSRRTHLFQEFDGSDAGASPDEAVSWGKIRIDAKPVKVVAEATLVFPLIVASCFAPRIEARKKAAKERAEKADAPPSPPAWASLVGQPASAAVAAIKASDPSLTVVVIPDDALVTKEYRADRCVEQMCYEARHHIDHHHHHHHHINHHRRRHHYTPSHEFPMC